MDMSNRGIPPRGLEVVLGTAVDPYQQDSLVMTNLGYFQLKANPGIWNLQLAPHGRSSLIYQIRDKTSHKIIIKEFSSSAGGSSITETLHVEKKKGMEKYSLFDESVDELLNKEKSNGNNWDLFGLFKNKKQEASGEQTGAAADDTIHVFSLASGHLYERFMKIMMLSVVKHTKQPVKFWLLSNFLSPGFKKFAPEMAKAYNFSVEFVTYKWPAWLHQQTEKQRIIWGYKILFLDVLFPLNVKKVIYVDADQVTYVDLKELIDEDLKGAPYGYTPFCSDDIMNPSTTGFRFWDSGYWKDHLQGLPYHISALYVVDLETLREKGYADQLRITYDGLSKDPNSLANLDQDLPNYLQHMVPIHSLSRNWLWCETWCTPESRPKAKTVDLCNNPLTKVPKLEAATRNIPEWTSYDEEIKALEKAVSQGTFVSTPSTTTEKAKTEGKVDL
eukprot:TRINITY_DN2750_c0_g1_i10.p1 TRINITY_DN2750_c0_g1~~TRINITY_DN2750_c0_g1_i10.p1  ORF type:complete len:445 (+),score=130.96 TRINITY_DN2750_c0_g1_i10:104-1438(+)